MKLDAQISAVVTGGASGLGAASARVLGETGVQVTLFDLDEERGSSLAKQLDGHFVRVDGSVHFVSESIDYRIYNEMGTRAGGEPASLAGGN